MTKKVTIALEENLIDELCLIATETGKKKTQVTQEALQDYFDAQVVTKTVREYKMGNLETFSHQKVRASLGL
jgi:predicted transcriptional regulator